MNLGLFWVMKIKNNNMTKLDNYIIVWDKNIIINIRKTIKRIIVNLNIIINIKKNFSNLIKKKI